MYRLIIFAALLLLVLSVGAEASAHNPPQPTQQQIQPQYVAVGPPRPQFRAFAPVRRLAYWATRPLQPIGYMQPMAQAYRCPNCGGYHR